MRTVFKKLSNVFIVILFLSCNWTSKEQNMRGLYGYTYCLDVKETSEMNKIHVGNGKLIFNRDKTFLVTNDSAKYSNIKGEWDLCCSGSDYGNFVLSIEGYAPFKSNIPTFIINVDEKKLNSFLCFVNKPKGHSSVMYPTLTCCYSSL
jgi:hypothetical protein